MKALFTFAFAITTTFLHMSAQNLVRNPDFEDKFTPAFGFNEIHKAYHWDAGMSSLPHGGPDLLTGELNTANLLQTPGANHFGYIVPQVSPLPWASTQQEGSIAGIVLWSDSAMDARTMLAGDLSAPLPANVPLYFSIDIALASRSSHTSQVGVRFLADDAGDGDAMMGNEDIRLPYPLTDTGWVTFAGTFILDQEARGFTIGNHHTDANIYAHPICHTDSVTAALSGMPWCPDSHQMAYMYVDNVCISPSPGGCSISTTTAQPPIIRNSGFVQDANGLWSHLSGREVTVIGMDAIQYAKGTKVQLPTVPGTYLLRCGNATHKVCRM